MNKKLYKSSTDKKICGVCGGIAEYFNIDATWVRLAFCIAALCLSAGIWPYIIYALILPKDTEIKTTETFKNDIYVHPEGYEDVLRCPNCGAELSSDINYCPNCGSPTE